METKRPHNLEEQISAYLDGELSKAERAEVERSLESDPHARRLLAELRQVHHLVGSLPREHAPPEIMELVTAQIERHELLKDGPVAAYGIPRRRPRWGRIVASAAVIAMAASAGYLTFQSFRKPVAPRPEERFGPVADAHRSTFPEVLRERTVPEATAKSKGAEYPRTDAASAPPRSLPAARPPQPAEQAAQALEPTPAARLGDEVPRAPMAPAPVVEIVKAGEPARLDSDASRKAGQVVAAKAVPTAEGSRVQEAVTTVPPVPMADIPTERQAAGIRPEGAIEAVPEELADRLEIELVFRDAGSRVRAGREIMHSLNRLAGSVVARSDLPDEQAAEQLMPGPPGRGSGSAQSKRAGREPGQETGRDSAQGRIVAHVPSACLPDVITRIERAAQTARAVGLTVGGRVVTDWEQVRVLTGGYGRYATPPSPEGSSAVSTTGVAVAGVAEPETDRAGATRAVGRPAAPRPPARSTVEGEAGGRRLEELLTSAGILPEGGLSTASLGKLLKDARAQGSPPMTQPCPSSVPTGGEGLEAKAGTQTGGLAESARDRAASGRPAHEASGSGCMSNRSPEPEIRLPEGESPRLRVVLVISSNPDGHPASAPLSGEQDRRQPATRPVP